MPNHTANRLYIKGSAKHLNEITEAIKSKDKAIDFNKIIPIPEVLVKAQSPCRIESAEVVAKLNAEREAEIKADPEKAEWFSGEAAITKEEQERRIKEYGFDNWYDWSIANWGTKWNAYGIDDGWTKDKKYICLYFETAWSPPMPIISKLSEEYPSCNFSLEYCDEGGGFVGYTTFEGGEVIDEGDFEWDSKMGIELRERLGRHFEEDEEEDDA